MICTSKGWRVEASPRAIIQPLRRARWAASNFLRIFFRIVIGGYVSAHPSPERMHANIITNRHPKRASREFLSTTQSWTGHPRRAVVMSGSHSEGFDLRRYGESREANR